MNNLSKFPKICLKHKTSRFLCPWNPYTHDYLGTYMEVLKNRSIRKIVEMGLGISGLFHPEQVAGCGLFMWQETFPDAEILGLDNDPRTLVNEGNIHSLICDQSKMESLEHAAGWVGRDIDFFVDDGSHVPEDQAKTAQVFVPLLSSTGVYVIEDVLPGGETSRLLGSSIKHRTVELRTNILPDDRLIIIEKSEQKLKAISA